jgi:predicted aldo/keto reductase-like oxidoreductase
MKYRRFGRTELQMPVISCGGMRYQFKWQDQEPGAIPKDNQENLEATIHRALELGINHIETARGYGTSEMQLGFLLPKIPRDQFILQTKVGPTEDPKEFLSEFEQSLKYLKVDHVDLFSFHGLNNQQTVDWTLRKDGCLDVVKKLKKEGRIRFIGFSTHAPVPIILKTIQSGEFDYINLHWYFVNPFTLPAVMEAAKLDMGVFIISPNDKGGKLYAPPPKLVELCKPLSPMIFNDLFCLARKEVHTLSCGASKPSDFDEHINALKYYEKIPETIAPIEKKLIAAIQETLGKDWYDTWHIGIPEYTEVPNEVNIFEILRLWTYSKSLDILEWAQFRYNLLGVAKHWFPGEKANKFEAAKTLPLLSQNRFADKIPEILKEAHHSFFVDKQVKRLSES